jgi:DNA-directed RNA polymerase subunit M/transcription elongation factor TFIIS
MELWISNSVSDNKIPDTSHRKSIKIFLSPSSVRKTTNSMLKTQLTSNNCMSTGEPELCPKCKKGHLRVGKASTISEDEPFTPTVHMEDLQCDNCGHTQKEATLAE